MHAILKRGDWGFGVDCSLMQRIVADYLRNSGKQEMFSDGKPGIDWLYGFQCRWKKELTLRVAEPLQVNRAYACNSRVFNEFFSKLTKIFKRLNLSVRPQNIFNIDELGLQTDIGSQKIFCRRMV